MPRKQTKTQKRRKCNDILVKARDLFSYGLLSAKDYDALERIVMKAVRKLD